MRTEGCLPKQTQSANNKKPATLGGFFADPASGLCGQLTLGELYRATGFTQTDFLPLHFPRITGDEPSIAQLATE